MNPLYSVAEIRAIEHTAAPLLPPGALMQRAGQAGANAALDLLPFSTNRAKVLVLAGPGNNGGDALETAAHLAYAGAQVSILHFDAPDGQSLERAAALQRARSSDARFVDLDPDAMAATEWNLVVDGLFGIGLRRPLDGAMRQLVEAVNLLRCSILALDVPSGLDADTGAIVGPDGVAVRATHTATFIGDKPGLHTCDGRDHAGIVEVCRLDLEASLFNSSRLHLNDVKFFSRHLRARRHNSHKGSYGNVAVIGGARGMSGAPVLSARAALYGGAGRVYALFAEDAPAYDSVHAELMCRLASDFDFNTATLVIGPGLGASRLAQDLLSRAIASDSLLLADADALNMISAEPALQNALRQRAVPAVLTPHPLEAARLLGCSTSDVQSDRLGAAQQLAERCRCCVLLKGSGSVIASPGSACTINATGNALLATAGTGDVLAGWIGGLWAQFPAAPAAQVACAATHRHGQAADRAAARGWSGPLRAADLIDAMLR